MRVFCMLLACYVLLLSSVPCCTDEVCCDETMAGSTEASQTEGQETDHPCTPFYCGSACAGFILFEGIYHPELSDAFSFTKCLTAIYKMPLTVSINMVIWQPPKIIYS